MWLVGATVVEQGPPLSGRGGRTVAPDLTTLTPAVSCRESSP